MPEEKVKSFKPERGSVEFLLSSALSHGPNLKHGGTTEYNAEKQLLLHLHPLAELLEVSSGKDPSLTVGLIKSLQLFC